MELEILKIGGPLALSIIVIWFIVRRFLETQERITKEFTTFIQIQQSDSKEIITNHLAHDQKLHEQTIKQMGDLEKTQKQFMGVIGQLMEFLKRNNK